MNKIMKLMIITTLLCSYTFAKIEPVVMLDFEQDAKNKQGLNDSSGFDIAAGDNAPFIITDKAVLEKMAGIKSLTISGWMKRPVSFNDIDKQIPALLNCPGHFRIEFCRWGRIALIMNGQDGRGKQVWSDWIGIVDVNRDDRWVFFAFTYDGTKGSPNAAFYLGYEQYVTSRVIYSAADAGQAQDDPDLMWTGEGKTQSTAGMLSAKPAAHIIIGAFDEKGTRPIDGIIDNIRIYTSTADNSACLDQSQIEAIRREDLGRERVEAEMIKAAKSEYEAKLRLWEIENKYWNESLNLHRVDVLERVFSDRAPMPLIGDEPVSVPRGGKVSFLFAGMCRDKVKVDAAISASPILSKGGGELDFPVAIYEVRHVPIEANNNGGIRTTISSRPPQIWMETLIRQAPFQLAEVLIPAARFELRENNMHDIMYKAVLVDVEVPADAKPGVYTSSLIMETPQGTKSCPLSFRVHKTNLPAKSLDNVYWFKADPANLTTGNLPALWSDEHWQLIENSALTLHSFGQNIMSVALISHRDETVNFIQTIKNADGGYDFDFTMFDRWIETFLRCGFERFEGEGTFGGHTGSPLNVNAIDEKTGKTISLFTGASDFDQWCDFMAIFYQRLYSHLKSKGWEKNYVQSIIDEPTNMGNYKRAYEVTKKNMPGILTKEACGNIDYSDYIDIQVFNMALFKDSFQQVAKQRRQAGKGVWFYHCASPYPPYPNRHLDEPLACSRLFPWLVYQTNADGYLWWAANNYRGANPYKSSIGPLPGGITNPGHGPGDDWMYYPGEKGLLGSMRMLAFRDGLTDYALLDMLAQTDRGAADEFAAKIIRTPIDYEINPAAYNKARRELLEKLDGLAE